MAEVIAMAARFRLDELLEELEVSQSELARLSGVTFVTINAIANNRTRQVRLDTLDKLAAAIGREPGELIVRESMPRLPRKKSTRKTA